MTEILGTVSNDELSGGEGTDSLFGLAGDDTILGLGGDDFVFGNQGEDVLDGSQGNDTIFGGKEDDVILDIGGGDDFVFGNLGNDDIFAGEGNDQVFGGQADDFVFGGAGNDFVSGDKGSDVVDGTDPGNTTNPGFGQIDTLVGGEGFDVFLLGFESLSYYIGSGNSDFALITDFNITEDEIVVSSTDAVTVSDLNLNELGSGVGIFSQNGDLIGFVQGLTASQLRIDIEIIRI